MLVFSLIEIAAKNLYNVLKTEFYSQMVHIQEFFVHKLVLELLDFVGISHHKVEIGVIVYRCTDSTVVVEEFIFRYLKKQKCIKIIP